MTDPLIQDIQKAITQLNEDYTSLSEGYALLTATVSKMQVDLAVLTSQVGEIVWVWRILAGIVLTIIVTKILKLILKNNKNKLDK